MRERLRVLVVGDREPAPALNALRAAGMVREVQLAETPAEAGRGAAAADLALVSGGASPRPALAGLRALRDQDPYLPALALVTSERQAEEFEEAGASAVVAPGHLDDVPDLARRHLLAAAPPRAERRLAEERLAHRQLVEVIGADDLEGAFEVAARQALTLAGADVAGVYRVEGEQAALVAGASFAGRPVPSGPAPDLGVAAVAEAPIVADGRRWGVLWVAADAPRVLPRDASERLAGLAGLLALTVRTTRIRAELEARAATDPLTGLANRRTFEERLGHEFARARRHRRRLALVLVDIDDFKALNDSAGHQAGDRALAAVARRIGGVARGGDLVARLGGDEFAWLIPEADGWAALQAAERAREAIIRDPVVDRVYVTASAGVAEIGPGFDPEALTRAADRALYQAKRGGRDAAYLYSPEHDEASALPRGVRAGGAPSKDARGVRLLAQAAAARSPFGPGHAERAAEVSAAIAARLGWDESACAALREATAMHDIGLVAVATPLLERDDLSGSELAQYKAHVEIGSALLGPVLSAEQISWVRAHHERWDGEGYPDGAAAEEIPEGGRIMAVALAFAEATAPVPAGRGLDVESAVGALAAEAGAALWPEAVEELAQSVLAPETPSAGPAPRQDDL